MFSPDIWFCSILTFIRFFFSFFSYGQVVKKSLEKAAEQQLDSNKLLVTKSKWNAVANFSKVNSVNLSPLPKCPPFISWLNSVRQEGKVFGSQPGPWAKYLPIQPSLSVNKHILLTDLRTHVTEKECSAHRVLWWPVIGCCSQVSPVISTPPTKKITNQ